MNVVLVAVVALVVVAAVALLSGGKKQKKGALTMQYQPFKLQEKKQLTHNTYFFRFELPAGTPLGLPTGNHMLLKFTGEDGKDVSRQYTPVTSDDDLGHFDLVIKTYPNGKMTQHLAAMEVGATIECRGPLGHLRYAGAGEFQIKRKNKQTRKTEVVPQKVRHVGLIAGGTGITPMLQIVREVTKNGSDRTSLSLVFANVSEDDILLRQELDELASHHANFKVFYTLDRPSDSWKGGKGFVSTDMIQEHLPAPADDTLVLVCGPPPMVKAMENNLEKLEYSETMRFLY